MKLKISDKKKKIIKRIYKIVLIFIGVIIVFFNDVFGKLEGFTEFLAFYFIVIFITILYWLFKQIRSIIRLKNEKAKTELLHLKSQVNPHFFFNTLNNLYGLMEKDSKERQMVLKLSDMMRYSIYEGQKDWVSLKDELNYLQNYIELQEIRYHKKSDVQFSHQINNPQAKIMPLLFIILLENAYKHGLENLAENAYIHMNLTESKHEVNFEIENNFETVQNSNHEGIGLVNLKRRLALVYPKKHTLSFDVDTNIYKVKLSIKLK
ncbi:sensor histidine kinase [Tenacibaculum retecalamus]|uniref:sensor histidine kinase n=1 Tax=Tenacibaculum retecalamus TaxID=3018315 RepID=UPI0023D8FCAE|nr:sensor histidine kinase [Tenacibaculum retecalamus]WBX72306.1 sensor histidine kinase [Tenacibaculum retecalamus]